MNKRIKYLEEDLHLARARIQELEAVVDVYERLTGKHRLVLVRWESGQPVFEDEKQHKSVPDIMAARYYKENDNG